MGPYPGLELASGLKKIGIQFIVKDILVFTQNRILQEIKGSDGMRSLRMVGFGFGFA
jgi:hypothetical protein